MAHSSSAQILSPTHNRTRWASQVTATHVLPEYPRPQMVRSQWTNLNGTWDYAVTDRRAGQPRTWEGTILVPFAIQSQLSTVERAVSDSERLWYHRTFTAAAPARGGRLLLHFGAVDWDATVFVNGKRIGQHLGGYDPFLYDLRVTYG
ncbi:MAG: sugar-binding domain-containing protein, partial [Gemmatimonadota bacterium]